MCFKFVFNIGKASGSAVEIFTIADTALTIIMWIILKRFQKEKLEKLVVLMIATAYIGCQTF